MVFVTEEQDKYNYIFPSPAKQEYFEKYYTLKKVYPIESLFDFYKSAISTNSDIVIEHNALYEKDEYSLVVDDTGVKITSSCDCGTFRAITSLRQLVIWQAVMYCEIHDKPQFKRRGCMLDISRGRKPRVDEIKRMIDYLSGLKYNELQLYMEDFCYLYPGFEDVIPDHDVLRPCDIVELDAYAKERFIDLVPNQNSFGHLGTWLATDEYKELEVGYSYGQKTDTIDITNPKTFELFKKIYDGLLPYFSADRVHIGLDEAYGLGRFELEDACKRQGREAVFIGWLEKLATYIRKKYNKRVLFWNDMLQDNFEFFAQTPNDCMPVQWNYEDISAQFIERRCEALQKANREYYVAPSTCTWSSLTSRFHDAEMNLRYMAETGYKFGATGYLVTQWGNDGHQQFYVNDLIPLAIGAQFCWNTGIKQHGGWRKMVFSHNAFDYVNKFVFNSAKVAKILADLGNYYLLEPELIHGGTICSYTLISPLANNIRTDFYDLDKIGNDFYFNNIINYVTKLLDMLSSCSFDERLKREIILNSKMIILGAKYAIIKLHHSATNEQKKEITALSLWIEQEFEELWLYRSYRAGVEITLNQLVSRRAELNDL